MVKIAIVYSSGHGHTRTVAKGLGRGVEESGFATADLLEIHSGQVGSDGKWMDQVIMQQLAEADGIIFGSPTYMGSAHGLFKLFLESAFMPWLDQVWKDKIAAGFTNSASRSGDKLVALEQFAVFAAQMSMIWVGVGDPPGGNYSATKPTDVNLTGSWLGLMTQSYGDGTPEVAPHPGDLLSAERFGRRIARTTARWTLGAEAFPTQRISEAESRRRNIEGIPEWKRFQD